MENKPPENIIGDIVEVIDGRNGSIHLYQVTGQSLTGIYMNCEYIGPKEV